MPLGKSKNREKRSMRLRSVTAYAENEQFSFPFAPFSPLCRALALGHEGLPQETCCIEGFDT